MSRKKIDWVDTLKSYVKSKPQRSAQLIDDETDRLFVNYIQVSKKYLSFSKKANSQKIPSVLKYVKRPVIDSSNIRLHKF